MKIKTQDSKNIDLADTAFGVPYNEALVHQVVNAVLSGARAGTKAQKIVLQFLVVAQNLGSKKEQEGQEREL
jgi:hypothetical protein